MGFRGQVLPFAPWHCFSRLDGKTPALDLPVVTVAVGQRVSAGSTLLSLEAMKIETHVADDHDAEVETFYVVAGDRLQAKELLVVLRAVGGGAEWSAA